MRTNDHSNVVMVLNLKPCNCGATTSFMGKSTM